MTTAPDPAPVSSPASRRGVSAGLPPPTRIRPARLFLYSLVWLVFGGVIAVQGWAFDLLRRGAEATPLYQWGGFILPRWAPWVVLTPAVLWFTERLRRTRAGRGWQVAGHVVAGVFVSAVHATVAVLIYQVMYPATIGTNGFGKNFVAQLGSQGSVSLLVYALVVGTWMAFDGWRTVVLRERQAEVLAHEYDKSRLSLLQTQLQPHFLFNTLHAVTVLVTRDPERAAQMLVRLGDFLRTTLAGSGRAEVTLDEELRMLDDYLDLQRTRFRDRLQVVINVPVECRDVLVPTLVLQPLIENAIRHGIEHRPGGGRVSVTAAREGLRLSLEVANDGPAGDPTITGNGARIGTGLRTTMERLDRLYGSDHAFSISPRPDGRVVADLRIPARRAAT